MFGDNKKAQEDLFMGYDLKNDSRRIE